MLPEQASGGNDEDTPPQQPPCRTHVPTAFSGRAALRLRAKVSTAHLGSVGGSGRVHLCLCVCLATPENFFFHFHYFRMRRAELEAFHFYNYFASAQPPLALLHFPHAPLLSRCLRLRLVRRHFRKASREGVKNV